MLAGSAISENRTVERASTYDLEEIEQSGLFDVEFYLAQAPEAKSHPRGPVAHYLEIGAESGLDPHWLFDTSFYSSCNPDLALKSINPLLHFILSGAANSVNPHPLFDISFYLRSHPEVAKSGINPLLHYVKIGAREGANPHALFDANFYIEQQPAGLSSDQNPLWHFLKRRRGTLLSPHPLFDLPFYYSMNSDLKHAGLNPLIHYVTIGAPSGRDPHPLFDSSFYLAQKPQEITDGANPLAHFLEHGGRDGCDPHPLFDVSFYLDMYPEVAKAGMNPLVHYVRFGAAEQRDPSPFFDNAYYAEAYPSVCQTGADPLIHYLSDGAKLGYNPSPLFDTRYYIQSYLKPGSEFHKDRELKREPRIEREFSPCIEPAPLVRLGEHELVRAVEPASGPLQGVGSAARPARGAGSGIEEMECNPLVHHARFGRFENRLTRRPEPDLAFLEDVWRCLDFGAGINSACTKLLRAIARPCKHLFLLGCLMRGGAERSACHCIRLAAEKNALQDILVVVTDCETITCPEWLPEGTRLVNLAELYGKLSTYDKGALLMRLMTITRAETVHVFNSPRAYAAVAYYFDHFPRPPARIYSYLCGYEIYTDHNFSGFNDGALYRSARHLDLMITDNNRLRETISERYSHVPSIGSKAVTCYQPLTTTLHEVLSVDSGGQDEINGRRKVLWASRLDDTKRPDVLAKIAQCLPDVHFDVYGYSSSGYDFSYLRKLKNVNLMGEFNDFSKIPKQDKAVFLYTSQADGMPNVLLEAIASGLPIVAPNVGGIRELITDNSGWLVRRFDDVDRYARLLRHVLSNPEAAKDRAQHALTLLKVRHSWSAFSNRLTNLGVF